MFKTWSEFQIVWRSNFISSPPLIKYNTEITSFGYLFEYCTIMPITSRSIKILLRWINNGKSYLIRLPINFKNWVLLQFIVKPILLNHLYLKFTVFLLTR